MNKKEIFKKIIIEFQTSETGLFPRELKLPVDIKKVITLYGPRRCGKTYLFYQTIQELRNKNIPIDRMFYINFEDERILPFFKEDWETLLDSYFELYPENVNKIVYLFLDEIQEAPMWEKFVRRLSEKDNFRIYLTGSSSKLFSSDIVTALRGRTLSYLLMPLSFKEFLIAKGLKFGKHPEYSLLRHKIKNLFQEYTKFGGFPETVDKPEFFKTQILQGYFELIFYKDLVERYKIRNFTLMKELMRYLITNFASLFSLTGYYNFLKSSGQKIGKETLFEYLSCMEEVNFVKLVPIFDYSLKRQVVNPKKVYCIDTGLINAVSFQFSENHGRYLENILYLDLLRRNKEIYYYKDTKGNEVDFLITEGRKPKQLIQVCSSMSEHKTEEREIKALVNAAEELKVKECFIITNDERKIIKNSIEIKVMPLWYWMMNVE